MHGSMSSRMTRIIMTSVAFLFLVIPLAFSQETKARTSSDWGIVIKKKDITVKAKFYQYLAGGRTIEIFAVKASDGTIRTALNTCQICYSSGRGYYKQEGIVFVCQNCGNRFSLDQIEKIRG
ncbi:MAG TPA: Fe-S-containing protein, partial [Rectinemataceae bacterium]|nr:Fe-S-containing protein [Rectinemataceae bacterium]